MSAVDVDVSNADTKVLLDRIPRIRESVNSKQPLPGTVEHERVSVVETMQVHNISSSVLAIPRDEDLETATCDGLLVHCAMTDRVKVFWPVMLA